MPASSYVRAFALGLACGCRSQSGIAALAWTAPSERGPVLSGRTLTDPLGRRGHGALTQALSNRWAKLSTGLALAGEVIGDKAPTAPARTAAPPLAARLVLGSLAGWALAERFGANRVVGAGSALAGSAVTTLAGPRYRAALAAKAPTIGPLSSDIPGAVAEDVVTIGLARAAAR